MRRFAVSLLFICACGGKIDDGTNSSTDSGPDTGGDESTPPTACKPNTSACKSSTECCSGTCGLSRTCQPAAPPVTPQCKGDGSSCAGANECCSNVCNNHFCGNVACATPSNKLCDQCVAQSCCGQMVTCDNDPGCTKWLTCVQSCEQQGTSAFACAQAACTGLQGSVEASLYFCAQQYCSSPCLQD